MIEYNEWKIWNGGECPVEPGTMGQVILKSESAHTAELGGTYDLSEMIWARVFAYRTVKEPVVEVVSGTSFIKMSGATVDLAVHLNVTLTDGKVTAVELAE